MQERCLKFRILLMSAKSNLLPLKRKAPSMPTCNQNLRELNKAEAKIELFVVFQSWAPFLHLSRDCLQVCSRTTKTAVPMALIGLPVYLSCQNAALRELFSFRSNFSDSADISRIRFFVWSCFHFWRPTAVRNSGIASGGLSWFLIENLSLGYTRRTHVARHA